MLFVKSSNNNNSELVNLEHVTSVQINNPRNNPAQPNITFWYQEMEPNTVWFYEDFQDAENDYKKIQLITSCVDLGNRYIEHGKIAKINREGF